MSRFGLKMPSLIHLAASSRAGLWTAKRARSLRPEEGISPRRLALTLALGLAIGCIPVIGVPTLLCAALAFALRLNLPAIQAANYAAMPLQILLAVPFFRLGGRLFAFRQTGGGPFASIGAAPLDGAKLPVLSHVSALAFVHGSADLALKAVLAWLVLAIPAVAILTVAFTGILRRMPALRAAEAGD